MCDLPRPVVRDLLRKMPLCTFIKVFAVAFENSGLLEQNKIEKTNSVASIGPFVYRGKAHREKNGGKKKKKKQQKKQGYLRVASPNKKIYPETKEEREESKAKQGEEGRRSTIITQVCDP